MRAASTLVWVLPALLGCNSLTGVSDLEPVDCVECADARVDSAVVDTGRPDTGRVDTALELGVGDTLDAATDAPRACTDNADCDDDDACTTDFCSGLLTCASTPLDRDGDGESPTAGACGPDCNDTNKDVFSTQTAYFATAHSSPGMLASFDYNCDGTIERESTALVRCQNVGDECTLINPGWVSSVPPCGATGKWGGSCRRLLSGCIPLQTDRVQRCR